MYSFDAKLLLNVSNKGVKDLMLHVSKPSAEREDLKRTETKRRKAMMCQRM